MPTQGPYSIGYQKGLLGEPFIQIYTSEEDKRLYRIGWGMGFEEWSRQQNQN